MTGSILYTNSEHLYQRETDGIQVSSRLHNVLRLQHRERHGPKSQGAVQTDGIKSFVSQRKF